MDNRFAKWRACLNMGWVFAVALFLFWAVLAQGMPPFPPTAGADTIARFYQEYSVSIRIGMLGAIMFTGCYLVWGLGITRVMEAVEGEENTLATIQLWGAGLTAVIFLLAFIIFAVGGYRPHSLPPWMLEFLYDAGWITLFVPLTSVFMQYITIAIVFLSDKRAEPLIPRWVSWYNILMVLLSFGVQLLPFLMTGIFARGGIINFWFEAAIYFLWIILMTAYGVRAVNRLEKEAAGVRPVA